MVEKNIHQTWKDAVPDHWIHKKSQQSVREMLPAWSYKLWTDTDLDDLVSGLFPKYYSAWRDLNQVIKRVDVARYFMLYQFGGMYADLDFVFTKNPEPLFQDGSSLFFYQTTQAIVKGWDFLGNAFMASMAGLSFWLELVDYMLGLPRDTPVLHHTGPRAIGAFWKTLQTKPAATVFGPDIFDNDRCQDGVGQHAFGYHTRMATWQRPGK